jgi:DNA-binding LytR/AlgR family response regulator
MKNNKRKVLLISHDTSSTAYLAQVLEKSGSYAVKTATTGRAAVGIHKQTAIDLAFCDVELKGSWSSAETVRQLRLLNPLAIIYLTDPASEQLPPPAQTNPATPVTYLHKPVSFDELFQTIDAVVGSLNDKSVAKLPARRLEEADLEEGTELKKHKLGREAIFMIDDNIFIKYNYQFVKVSLKDIILLEANNMYVTLITTNRKFVLRLTLSSLLERLNLETLVRVHRSFAINIQKVDLFTEHEVIIGQHRVPLGRHFRRQFIDHFQFR